MKKTNTSTEHKYHFIQNSGLIQVNISTIEDILNLDKLDPKLWTALACPVSGLEFSEETLNFLDSDKNGRVRVPEILNAVEYIKKYFAQPEVIMQKGNTIPLNALSTTPFPSGHSPLDSAKSVLEILGKQNATEISLSDINVNEKLFASNVINGDGVLPAECVKEENIQSIVKNIIECTGGTDDISGAKGINRSQFEDFFKQIRAVKEWREEAVQTDPKIFFLKEKTDAAAKSFMKLQEKINDYFLRCALLKYDNNANEILKHETDTLYLDENGNLANKEQLSKLPIAYCEGGKPLPLNETVNPIWKSQIEEFKKNVIIPIFQKEIETLSETNWRKIESLFEPYVEWHKAIPKNQTSDLGLDRISDILNSDAENKINEYLDKEEKHPPIALSTIELKKMLLLRRDFVELLQNFVSFEQFYKSDDKAIFQCGTLFIDGRSCDLCFKVLDIAKHSKMSALSQCFLVYCDCVKRNDSGEKMQIAALISDGETDNILVGRNGLFYDRKGNDWDATIVKIEENPISIKQAFWSPYKRLMKFIQEKIAKTTNEAESKVFDKMSKVVDNPKEITNTTKKTDIGTVAAISVAFTGIATVVGGILQAFLGLGMWIPLGIIGIVLIISLPSMIIAWRKLKQRNIASILDASGWAINGNVKISPALGTSLTHLPKRPATAYFSPVDPFAIKKAPVKRIIAFVIFIAIIATLIFLSIKFPEKTKAIWGSLKNSCINFGSNVTNITE